MNQQNYQVGGVLDLTMSFEEARFHLCPESLFSLAVRQNNRRAFLFVSKLLGKHLPIRPSVLFAAGKLLSLAVLSEQGIETDAQYWSDLVNGSIDPPFSEVQEKLEATQYSLDEQNRTLMIGFAETATGLARAAADGFRGEIAYLETTRLEQPGQQPLTFSEDHSHAKTHLLYLGEEGERFMKDCKRVILVDDELTTGSTALNLIARIHERYGTGKFTILSILDCSDGEQRRKLEQTAGIQIQVISLLKGRLERAEMTATPEPEWACFQGTEGIGFSQMELSNWEGRVLPGRQFLSAAGMERQRLLCREIGLSLPQMEGETLYLGTGEWIYVPALIAGWAGGERYHSTTQSPVFPLEGTAITTGARFDSPDSYSPVGYLYNVPQDEYQNAVIFTEKLAMKEQGLCQAAAYLKSRGVGRIEIGAL